MGNQTSTTSKNGNTSLKHHIVQQDRFIITLSMLEFGIEDLNNSEELNTIDKHLCSDVFIRTVIPIRVYLHRRLINQDKKTYKLFISAVNTIECYTRKQFIKDIKKNLSRQILLHKNLQTLDINSSVTFDQIK